ncbi:MAG: hypothetical protein KDN19_07210 [Verrucomicrobiae bacterium]|nr:hypothetical protein [Verrucomicrobiae bacterium]
MRIIHFDDTVIVLDNITRVSFEENDTSIVADNRCLIYFVGSGADPFVVRGEKAKPVFDRLLESLQSD